jgi:hypothetical protein
LIDHLSVSGTNKALTSSSNHGFHLYLWGRPHVLLRRKPPAKKQTFRVPGKETHRETWGNLGSLGFTTTEAMAPPTKQTFSRSSKIKNIWCRTVKFQIYWTFGLYMAPTTKQTFSRSGKETHVFYLYHRTSFSLVLVFSQPLYSGISRRILLSKAED